MTDNAKKLADKLYLSCLYVDRELSVEAIESALTAQYNQAIEDAKGELADGNLHYCQKSIMETEPMKKIVWDAMAETLANAAEKIEALKKKVADETRSGNELWAEDLNDDRQE